MGRRAGRTNAETRELVRATWYQLQDQQPTAREVAELADVAVQTAAKHRPDEVKDWSGEKPKEASVGFSFAQRRPGPRAKIDPDEGTKSAEIVAYMRGKPVDETTGDVARRFGVSTTLVMQLNRRYVPEWVPMSPRRSNKAERVRTALTKMMLRREQWTVDRLLTEAGQPVDQKGRAYARSIARPILERSGMELAPDPEPLEAVSKGLAAQIVAEWQNNPKLTVKQLTKRYGEHPEEVWEALRLWAQATV